MRKTEKFTVTAEGRDKGKVFVLTEMPADQGERWANRIAFALANTGAAIPDDALGAGWAGLAALGIQAIGLLKSETVQPLLDEIWPTCVRYENRVPGGSVTMQEIASGINSQIEEVATRYAIYYAVWKLHTGFSLPEVSPTSESQPPGSVKDGWITSMSRAVLGLLSRFALPR